MGLNLYYESIFPRHVIGIHTRSMRRQPCLPSYECISRHPLAFCCTYAQVFRSSEAERLGDGTDKLLPSSAR